ncbi:hypothetical protein EV356DRAFT_502657 [Viridothelium virens]|uniref:Uncharacterized protein n=1 Tax=Viridothelium virens TaxID=1048519 RepID=A0A6A6H7R9_VIRVR|nr:hypothetical protein EV356DRAFT_502657 [Viridothelium virens]
MLQFFSCVCHGHVPEQGPRDFWEIAFTLMALRDQSNVRKPASTSQRAPPTKQRVPFEPRSIDELHVCPDWRKTKYSDVCAKKEMGKPLVTENCNFKKLPYCLELIHPVKKTAPERTSIHHSFSSKEVLHSECTARCRSNERKMR